MSDPTGYLTVARAASVEIEVKRSRFLCRIERVASEQSARAVIEEERRRHREARHHCSAWVLGPERVRHSNDDGEPPGTAGGPMLEVLRGRGVSDVVAVVSRYFGGVLLGAGGLVRAYSDAVRAGLDQAGVLQRRLMARFDVDVPWADVGKLENGLRAHGVTVVGTEYGARASLHLAVPAADASSLSRLVAELSGGETEPKPAGSGWVDP